MYIPTAMMFGVLGGYVAEKLSSQSQWRSIGLSLILICLGLWKLPSLPAQIDRDFDLSTRPDIHAAAWIRDNLPENTFFLTNGIIYTGGTSGVGGDAGWWLPILTKRGVVIPPQYALLGEESIEPGYSNSVNNLVISLFDTSPVTAEGKRLICSFPQPITHVYLGQRRGLVSKALPNQPSHPMLPAELLLQDPAFHLVYHQDRVMIFEFDRPLACDQIIGGETG
jgi:hypothetical protein